MPRLLRAHGYTVIKVFRDDVSGHRDFMSHRGMVGLLDFLDQRMRKPLAVVFDDLKRFARDTIFHLKLREELALRNATVECPNFKFEETPEGMFVETVIATHGELRAPPDPSANAPKDEGSSRARLLPF